MSLRKEHVQIGNKDYKNTLDSCFMYHILVAYNNQTKWVDENVICFFFASQNDIQLTCVEITGKISWLNFAGKNVLPAS